MTDTIAVFEDMEEDPLYDTEIETGIPYLRLACSRSVISDWLAFMVDFDLLIQSLKSYLHSVSAVEPGALLAFREGTL